MLPMTQVWERLYLGSRIDAEHLAKSNPHAITTVISLCEEPVIQRASGINYLRHPIVDDHFLPQSTLDAILDAIAENIRWGTVLLHCGSGISRAPIFSAAWMDAVGYKSLEAALEEIAERRRIIAPSSTLLRAVRKSLR